MKHRKYYGDLPRPAFRTVVMAFAENENVKADFSPNGALIHW